jgi:16S rRNA (cytosine967-C5)-methyltransferase
VNVLNPPPESAAVTSAAPSLSPLLSQVLVFAGGAIAGVIAGRSLNQAFAAVPAAARPAAMDLAYGAVRFLARYRFFLSRLLTRADTDAEVMGVLLAALHALYSRPLAPHMVVDQAVDAAAGIGRGAAKGMVNAVLRNFLRQRAALEAAADAIESARYSYPAWWIAHLKAAYPDAWQAILVSGNEHPPMSLRVNRRRDSVTACLARLAAAGMPARAIEDCGVMLEQPVPVERLPGFAEGLLSVQDLGAQVAAPLLDVLDGMRVLDACAAPGGKTGHLLELADLELTAIDLDAARLSRVRANLDRLGLRAKLMVGDCGDSDAAWWDGQAFDRILLDAPCSASGVVRRHPDGKWLRRETDLAGFAAAQSRILDTLWRMLGRDGKLLYATCSVFPEENTGRIAAFLDTHRDARLIPDPYSNDAQLLPNRDHDGFFYALLARQN